VPVLEPDGVLEPPPPQPVNASAVAKADKRKTGKVVIFKFFMFVSSFNNCSEQKGWHSDFVFSRYAVTTMTSFY
jgi:hypothetical protein